MKTWKGKGGRGRDFFNMQYLFHWVHTKQYYTLTRKHSKVARRSKAQSIIYIRLSKFPISTKTKTPATLLGNYLYPSLIIARLNGIND